MESRQPGYRLHLQLTQTDGKLEFEHLDDLHTERFAIARTDKGGEGGEKVGIQMPFGCRMGICQTCVLPLESGYVRDFRSGEEHGAGDRINTCVSTASDDCTLKI